MPGTKVFIQSDLAAVGTVTVDDTHEFFLQESLPLIVGGHVTIIHMQEEI